MTTITAALSPDDYRFLSELLRKQSGLALGGDKGYLLESRLAPVAARFRHDGLPALVRGLRMQSDPVQVKAVCDAMTTNETLFFRDTTPFKILQERALPEAMAHHQADRRLRIWCAAASTGQEPYTIAMILATLHPQLAGWQIELLATDYSAEALARAQRGVYSQFEVQRGLPVQYLLKFFHQTPEGWQISDELRHRVRFREANLLDSFAPFGTFDIIFCRNVLIYFDADTKRDVMDRLVTSLAPWGRLFLGGAETPFGITDRIVRLPGAAGVYARAESLGVGTGATPRARGVAAS